jgi:hypothetical protein
MPGTPKVRKYSTFLNGLRQADACHGGDSCVLWEFLGSRQNLIAVKLLTGKTKGEVQLTAIEIESTAVDCNRGQKGAAIYHQ